MIGRAKKTVNGDKIEFDGSLVGSVLNRPTDTGKKHVIEINVKTSAKPGAGFQSTDVNYIIFQLVESETVKCSTNKLKHGHGPTFQDGADDSFLPADGSYGLCENYRFSKNTKLSKFIVHHYGHDKWIFDKIGLVFSDGSKELCQAPAGTELDGTGHFDCITGQQSDHGPLCVRCRQIVKIESQSSNVDGAHSQSLGRLKVEFRAENQQNCTTNWLGDPNKIVVPSIGQYSNFLNNGQFGECGNYDFTGRIDYVRIISQGADSLQWDFINITFTNYDFLGCSKSEAFLDTSIVYEGLGGWFRVDICKNSSDPTSTPLKEYKGHKYPPENCIRD